jgi:hypothetical protein
MFTNVRRDRIVMTIWKVADNFQPYPATGGLSLGVTGSWTT